MQNKSEFFKTNPDFIWHLDDDWIEIEFINDDSKGKKACGISKTISIAS